jgi:signal transduction histidine kinase
MLMASVPDLILIDGATNGMGVCAALKKSRPHVPVMVVIEPLQRAEAIRAGADHVLTRPIDLDELLVRARWLVEIGGRHQAVQAKLESMLLWHDWVRYLVHDLRNPVMLAVAHVSLAREHGASPQIERDLLEAERSLDLMTAMLRDILDSDRIRHGVLVPQVESIDLRELASTTVTQLALTHPVEIAGEGDTTLAVDAMLLGRVFRNLITNADRHAKNEPIRVEVTGTAHGVSARVTNDGEAVAAEVAPHLFEPWRQVDGGYQRGTGIGLAFCRLVCDAHDGKIWLDSAAAGSVTFAFGLPRVPRAPAI